jgi:hypothetical protein
MEDDEIERGIATLSNEDRGWLFHICETRYEHRHRGPPIAEYVKIPASCAKVLRDLGLAWLLPTSDEYAAATHPVYDYYVREIKEAG